MNFTNQLLNDVYQHISNIFIYSVEYLWVDTNHKAKNISAPDYIHRSLSFIQGCLDDEKIFPTQRGKGISHFVFEMQNHFCIKI